MSEKTVREALAHRRSVRNYDDQSPIDSTVVKECIVQATMAPSSSNMQLWEFYHIVSPEVLKQVAKACFNQPAAKTAQQLVVVVVRKDLWKARIQDNVEHIQSHFSKDKYSNRKKLNGALTYYNKIVYNLYNDRFGINSMLKYYAMAWKGIFKTTYREVTKSDIRVVAHKSVALAAQTFMMSMASVGYDTCPMEGFDSKRTKKILGLPKGAEINMIVSCGIRTAKGIYGERFRLPLEKVYFKL